MFSELQHDVPVADNFYATRKKEKEKNPRENNNFPHLCEIRGLCKMYFISDLLHRGMVE